MLRNRRRWIVTSLVLVISAVAYVDRVNLSVAAPVLTKEFHTNAAVMGLLLSSFTWTYALVNIPAGMLVDRVRTRFLYSGAMLLWALASFLTVLTNSVGALFGPRLLLGVAESPFIPASVRTLSDWLPSSERGRGGGVFISGVALGSAVGPPVLGWLVSGFGWRSAFIATGVLSVMFAAGWFLWYRHPSEDRRLSDSERELIRAGQEPSRPRGQSRAPWSTLIRSRDIWAITGGYFCLLYIQYTFVSWLPSYLVQDRHMTVLKSGFATSIPWTCAFLVAVLFGRTSDVLMRRGWSALNARKVVLVGGMLAALAILGTAFSSSATTAIAFLSISTSGIVLANGAAWAATQDVTRRLDLPGSAAGFINGVSNVGGILGPIVTGALVYATDSFVVPLVVAAGVALTGGLIWLLGIRARAGQVATAAAVGGGAVGGGAVGGGAAGGGAAGGGAAGGAAAVGGAGGVAAVGGGSAGARGGRRLVLAGMAAVAVLAVAGLAVYPALRAHPSSPTRLADQAAGPAAGAETGAATGAETGAPAGAQTGGTPAPASGGPGAGQPVPGQAAPGAGQPMPDQGAPGAGQPVPDQGAPGAGQPVPDQARVPGAAPEPFATTPRQGGPVIDAAPGPSTGGRTGTTLQPSYPAHPARSGLGAPAGQVVSRSIAGSTGSPGRVGGGHESDGTSGDGRGRRDGDGRGDDRDDDHGDGRRGSGHSDDRHGGENGGDTDDGSTGSAVDGLLDVPGLEAPVPTSLVGGLLRQ